MDTRLSKNQAEFGVLVLVVALQMLTDGDGLLDQEVQILRKIGGETAGLQDAEDLVAGDALDHGDTSAITEHDTDLGGGLFSIFVTRKKHAK